MFTVEPPSQRFDAETILCVAGSFGDLVNMLPLFRSEANKWQRPAKVIVKKSYAEILDGVSYVEPIIYDGDINQLYDFVKKKISVRVRFINPPPIEHGFGGNAVKKETDSFVKEMWRLAGKLDMWGIEAPYFDRRNLECEKKLVDEHIAGLPTILVALNGRTSPFQFDQDLLKSLSERFPEHQIVDLCKIQSHRVYDLLGLMDAAKLLIASDTVHMHLSAASEVPVIALAQDRPSNWNGTPWHKRFILHCRYSLYPHRKEEILGAAANTLKGIQKVRTKPILNLNNAAYNPSLIDHFGQLYFAYRWHPARSAQTRLAMAELDAEFNVIKNSAVEMPPELGQFSHEDIKLFHRGEELWASFTVSKIPAMPMHCVVHYGKIETGDGRFVIKNTFQIKYGHNDWSGMEKNFVFFEA